MLTRIRRLLSQFFIRATTINNEPLNKVSLIVIILIDFFILINVFTGLNDIGRWYINPSQAYPCYSEWEHYRTSTDKNKDYEVVKLLLLYEKNNSANLKQTYQKDKGGHLGNVFEICLAYDKAKDKIFHVTNQKNIKAIDYKQTKISTIEQSNRNIHAQYDSTLLEEIAGQPREQSINSISAEKAKQELEKNNRNISKLVNEISNLKNELVAKPEIVSFIAFLKNDDKFRTVEKGYQQASFWYPSIQLAFQSLFLLPLILVALSVHKFAQRRGYGLISMISWNLLVIFFIPLILKIFEFLQIGAILKFIFDIISAIFGGLLFIISYVYILLIPFIGFVIIKFFQKIAFNHKLQVANRIQKIRCIKCVKKIRHHDIYCPHCGYYQYTECLNCHNLTYKNLPYCKECGYSQDSNNFQ